MQNKEFAVGQKVARAKALNRAGIVICTVTKVSGMKVYLDNSSQPMKQPELLAIII